MEVVESVQVYLVLLNFMLEEVVEVFQIVHILELVVMVVVEMEEVLKD